MESLGKDVVISYFGVEELFTLCLVCRHFRDMLNDKEVVDQLISIYIPSGPYPVPSEQSYFPCMEFGRFIYLYDTIVITSRIKNYYAPSLMGVSMRETLLTATRLDNATTLHNANSVNADLNEELSVNHRTYILHAIEHDAPKSFVFLLGLPELGLTRCEIVDLFVKHSSIKVVDAFIEWKCSTAPTGEISGIYFLCFIESVSVGLGNQKMIEFTLVKKQELLGRIYDGGTRGIGIPGI